MPAIIPRRSDPPIMMSEDDLIERLDELLKGLGARPGDGEVFASPPLDIARVWSRRVRLGRLPWLGRGASVVVLVREPDDDGSALGPGGTGVLLDRVGRAINGRFPPWGDPGGLVLGLTLIVLSPRPIAPEEAEALSTALNSATATSSRTRCVLLGLVRVDLSEEVTAFAVRPGPDGLFTEPLAVADAASEWFRRHVPRISF
jgi:hypothetical protein